MRKPFLGIVNEELGKDSYPFKVVEMEMTAPEMLWPDDVEKNKVAEVYYNANKEIVLHRALKNDSKITAGMLIPNSIPDYWDKILPDILMFHMHTFFEITRVVSGRAIYIFNNQCIEVNAGDIIMFNENKPHFWFPSPDAPVIIKVFHFFPNLLLSKNFTEEKYGFLYSLYSNHFSHLLLENGSDINTEISALLDEIYFEFTREKLAYQIMVIAKLLEMSSSLIRYLNSHPYAQANTPFPVKKYTGYNSVNEAIDFINTNYLDPKLTAAQISQHISMNNNYFSSLFKKSMGLTISDYISQLRISKSIELFANPNLSITEVSHLCGYETFSSYYRTFVRIFGISPSEYKKSHEKKAKNEDR